MGIFLILGVIGWSIGFLMTFYAEVPWFLSVPITLVVLWALARGQIDHPVRQEVREIWRDYLHDRRLRRSP